MDRQKYIRLVLVLLLILCAFPLVTAPIALLAGMVFSFTLGNPDEARTKKATHRLLQYSVVGLGFGMNASAALNAGMKGFFYTVAGISLTFTAGLFISKILKIKGKTPFLISAGTAICGGSAIAAVAPVIRAKNEETSVALGVVFVLNSVALILFPLIGHYFHLSQQQFGLWSAIAIHDTSSVVGSASQYGHQALMTATTVKLARALWIIPVSLVSAFIFKSDMRKIKIPYFIFAFVAAMILSSYFRALNPLFHMVYAASRQGLVITLFLIGLNLSPKTLKAVGLRPFVMGVLLWVTVATVTLFSIEYFLA